MNLDMRVDLPVEAVRTEETPADAGAEVVLDAAPSNGWVRPTARQDSLSDALSQQPSAGVRRAAPDCGAGWQEFANPRGFETFIGGAGI